jgi:hypothetical protein
LAVKAIAGVKRSRKISCCFPKGTMPSFLWET